MRRYPFGKFLLDIPDDHKIVSIHREAAFYDRAYGMLIEEIAKGAPGGTFLDIGGNIGDTAAFIASHVPNPIVSVEGNPAFTGYFKSNLRHFGEKVQLVEKFVRPSALHMAPLSYAGTEGTGYLTSSDTENIADDRFITPEELLEQAGNLALIKSDTDGLDGFIILDMMARAPDVPLFFECDTLLDPVQAQSPWPELFERLNSYALVVFDNQGLPMLSLEEGSGAVLRDLSGYLHLQRGVHPVRTHYLDVWAFPRSHREVHASIARHLRGDLLRPYRF